MAFVRFGDPVMPARRLRERHSVLRTLNRSGRPRGSRSRRASLAVAAGAAGSLALFGLAAPASAQPAQVSVPQGIGGAAVMQPTGVFTPGSTPETVSFILKARNAASLEGSVASGMPGGYLSVRRFASSYGQSAASIAALEKYLTGFGLKVSAYADGLDVNATGTADQFNSALTVQQQQYMVPAVAGPRRPAGPARQGNPRHGRRAAAAGQPGRVRAVDPGPDQLPDLQQHGRARVGPGHGGQAQHDPDRQPDAGRLRQAVQPEPAVQARARPAAAGRSASSRWPAWTRPPRSTSGTASCTSRPRRTGSRWITSTAGPARSATPPARTRRPWT